MIPRQIQLGALIGLLLPACAPQRHAVASDPAPTPTVAARSEPSAPPRTTPGELTAISLDELFQLHESGKALIFDARLPLFYHVAHIPGAINLPLARCEEKIQAMESDIKAALAAGKTIVTYCSGPSCPDAHTLATHLSRFGYPASVFDGGWDGWSSLNQ